MRLPFWQTASNAFSKLALPKCIWLNQVVFHVSYLSKHYGLSQLFWHNPLLNTPSAFRVWILQALSMSLDDGYIIFYCCNKTPCPKQHLEGRVYSECGTWFQWDTYSFFTTMIPFRQAWCCRSSWVTFSSIQETESSLEIAPVFWNPKPHNYSNKATPPKPLQIAFLYLETNIQIYEPMSLFFFKRP